MKPIGFSDLPLLDILPNFASQSSEYPDHRLIPFAGGEAPKDAAGVLSWDEDHLLIGGSTDKLKIIDRPGGAKPKGSAKSGKEKTKGGKK